MLDCAESDEDSYWAELFGNANVVAQPSGRWSCAQKRVNHESMEVEILDVAVLGLQSLLRTLAIPLERVEIVRATRSRRYHDCLNQRKIPS